MTDRGETMGQDTPIMPPKIPHADSKFKQQKIAACRPFLTPCSAAIIYAVFSAVSLIVGLIYFFESRGMYEQVIPYPENCGQTCTATFTVPEDEKGPIFVYYQIENLYQNNFLYGSSKSWSQLTGGGYKKTSDLKSCAPMILADPNNETYSGNILVPCGAVPNSVFNDTFTFNSEFPEIFDKDISLKSFRELFKAPSDVYKGDVQWLSEAMFPGGQTNERFINWVQIAPFKKFRKLWGKTAENSVLKAGEYSITIDNNFPVDSFDGKKSLVVAQVKWLGGKNDFFGIFFLVMCGISGTLSILFFVLYVTHALPLYRQGSRLGNTLEARLMA